jgi:hypothetical protein
LAGSPPAPGDTPKGGPAAIDDESPAADSTSGSKRFSALCGARTAGVFAAEAVRGSAFGRDWTGDGSTASAAPAVLVSTDVAAATGGAWSALFASGVAPDWSDC